MNPLMSGGMLAAALMLGQTGEPPSVSPSSVPPPPKLAPMPTQAPQPPQRGPILSFFTREDRPVLSKITSWFKRDQPDTSVQPMKGILQRETVTPMSMPPTAPPSNDFPRRLPNPSSKGPNPAPVVTVAMDAPPVASKEAGASKIVVQTTVQQTNVVKAAKSPILAQFVAKIGRDEKFEWLTGQLEMENGAYVLYYATPETVDKYQGRLVLQPQQVNMKDLHRRDLVCVSGKLVQRSALQGLGPVYRLTAVNLIERPKL